jgi:hypothetical protein
MNYEQIKRVREEFNLERHEVYTLMSEFNSLLYIQNNEEANSDEDEVVKKAAILNLGKDKTGITCDFLFHHATFIYVLPECKQRIITALGLDANSPHTTLNWEHYVTLYCMFEKSTYKDDGVRFWCTFFDPHGFGSVPEEEYMELLEMMVRGKSYEVSNHFTILYAEKMQLNFEENH